MTQEPLSMNKIRQILLFLERGASQRSIEKEVKVSRKTIVAYLEKFPQTEINFSDLLKYPDDKIEELLGLKKPIVSEDKDPRKLHFNSQLAYFNKELTRTGVTRLLLWDEYLKDLPIGFPIFSVLRITRGTPKDQ